MRSPHSNRRQWLYSPLIRYYTPYMETCFVNLVESGAPVLCQKLYQSACSQDWENAEKFQEQMRVY